MNLSEQSWKDKKYRLNAITYFVTHARSMHLRNAWRGLSNREGIRLREFPDLSGHLNK